MTLRHALAAGALLAAVATTSFAAEPMSKMDMDKMKACKAMSMEMMKKDAKCMEMAKMHPDMMKPMASGAMGKSDNMGAMPPKK